MLNLKELNFEKDWDQLSIKSITVNYLFSASNNLVSNELRWPTSCTPHTMHTVCSTIGFNYHCYFNCILVLMSTIMTQTQFEFEFDIEVTSDD